MIPILCIMYFFVNIKKYVKVPPEFLGPNMWDFIN